MDQLEAISLNYVQEINKFLVTFSDHREFKRTPFQIFEKYKSYFAPNLPTFVCGLYIIFIENENFLNMWKNTDNLHNLFQNERNFFELYKQTVNNLVSMKNVNTSFNQLVQDEIISFYQNNDMIIFTIKIDNSEIFICAIQINLRKLNKFHPNLRMKYHHEQKKNCQICYNDKATFASYCPYNGCNCNYYCRSCVEKTGKCPLCREEL